MTHRDTGQPAKCSSAGMDAFCWHHTWGAYLQQVCPLTCETCGDGCRDKDPTGISVGGAAASCAALAAHCENPAYEVAVKQACPMTCCVWTPATRPRRGAC